MKIEKEILAERFERYIVAINSADVATGMCIAEELNDLVSEIRQIRMLLSGKKIVNIEDLVGAIKKKTERSEEKE